MAKPVTFNPEPWKPEPADLAPWEKELRGYSIPGCGCSMCRELMRDPTRKGEPMKDKTCMRCVDHEMTIGKLDARIKSLGDEVVSLKEKAKMLPLIEAERDKFKKERDEYDREADNLAAGYEHAVIERDYLLKQNEWLTQELERAWERIESMEKVQ